MPYLKGVPASQLQPTNARQGCVPVLPEILIYKKLYFITARFDKIGQFESFQVGEVGFLHHITVMGGSLPFIRKERLN